MFSAKSCPQCGGVLRFEDDPGSFPAGRHLAAELAFWAAIALTFAFFYAPPDSGTLPLALAALAVAVWLMLRPQQRASARTLLARRQYCCARCRRRFEGGDIHGLHSH